MIPLIKDYKCIPKELWIYTTVAFIPVLRKTIFNVMNEVGTYDSVNQSTSMAMVFLMLAFVVLAKNSGTCKIAYRYTKPLFLYHILGFFSFIWAGQYFPIMFKASEVLVSIMLMSMIIYKIKSERLTLSYLILLCFVPILCDLISRRFSYFHTNVYSFSAAIGLLLCLGGWKYKIYRWKEVSLLTYFFVISILIGTSSASYISTIIGLIVYGGCSRKGVKLGKIVLIIAFALVGYKLFSDIILEYIFYGKDQSTIESGTGRVVIWEVYWKMIQDKPILGYGFLVGERMASLFYGLRINVISAHNSFLSALVGTGIIGLLFFLYFIVDWFITLMKKIKKRNIYAIIVFPTFAIFLVNTNSFPAIGSDWNYVGMVLYALYAFTKMNNNKTVK